MPFALLAFHKAPVPGTAAAVPARRVPVTAVSKISLLGLVFLLRLRLLAFLLVDQDRLNK